MTQFCGYAGIVILMLDTKMEPSIAKDMVRGAPDALWSEFRLGYAPLLAQLRSEDADPEVLLASSFRQFQLQRALPALQAAVTAKARSSSTLFPTPKRFRSCKRQSIPRRESIFFAPLQPFDLSMMMPHVTALTFPPIPAVEGAFSHASGSGIKGAHLLSLAEAS